MTRTLINRWLIALAVLAPCLTRAEAEITGSLDRVGRWVGAGWGDGYHACESSGLRVGADLPPRTYAQQTSRHRHRLARGTVRAAVTFYDRFDALAGNQAGPEGWHLDAGNSAGNGAGVVVRGSQVIVAGSDRSRPTPPHRPGRLAASPPVAPPAEAAGSLPAAGSPPTDVSPPASKVLAPSPNPVRRIAETGHPPQPSADCRPLPLSRRVQSLPVSAMPNQHVPPPIRDRSDNGSSEQTGDFSLLDSDQATSSGEEPASGEEPMPTLTPNDTPRAKQRIPSPTPHPIQPVHPGFHPGTRTERLLKAALGDNFRMPPRPQERIAAACEPRRADFDGQSESPPRQLPRATVELAKRRPSADSQFIVQPR